MWLVKVSSRWLHLKSTCLNRKKWIPTRLCCLGSNVKSEGSWYLLKTFLFLHLTDNYLNYFNTTQIHMHLVTNGSKYSLGTSCLAEQESAELEQESSNSIYCDILWYWKQGDMLLHCFFLFACKLLIKKANGVWELIQYHKTSHRICIYIFLQHNTKKMTSTKINMEDKGQN